MHMRGWIVGSCNSVVYIGSSLLVCVLAKPFSTCYSRTNDLKFISVLAREEWDDDAGGEQRAARYIIASCA